MKVRRLFSMLLALALLLSLFPTSAFAADGQTVQGYRIVIGEGATEMQEYAAKELRKYLYQLTNEDIPVVAATEGTDLTNAFVVGTLDANPLVSAVKTELDSLAATGADGHEGEQGYVLKKVDSTLYIAGTDDEGTLYGVYGLLDDYYGIGFYFSGDAIPENYTGPMMPEVNEAKTPRQYMRGVLPWTNFAQSATSYSTEDWMYVIDQMARMRMNFLNIHNYNAEAEHNEIFHNFEYNGVLSRVWNATAKIGHNWQSPGWDVNSYRFGAADLYDDYDFGTDGTLHTDYLNNEEVYAKGYSQFQYIIDYAHSRGVKIGLGLDIDIVLPVYEAEANAPGLPEARARDVLARYDDLDTVLLYISEHVFFDPTGEHFERWKDCFMRMYDTFREERPDLQIAVSGWGISAEVADWVPEDVVIAPISAYSAGFVDGNQQYPGKEYWGGPWAERDGNSSEYFFPYNVLLQETIDAYQVNKNDMDGLFTLSWRLTDGVDVKMMYIAKAPWDTAEKYTSEAAVYEEYARRCYGSGLEESTIADLTQLICYDERTVIPTNWGECEVTPDFKNVDRSGDIAALQGMIDRVDSAISQSTDPASIDRLNRLRYRLISEQAYCRLDANFNNTQWEDLQTDFAQFAQAFMYRVDDISSLGNNISVQNRFVQERYVERETLLREKQAIKAPLNVEAKGTSDGAVLTWEYEKGQSDGFVIYRDGAEIGRTDGDARVYYDTHDGSAVYTITALKGTEEGTPSIAQTCDAGSADHTAPKPIVVSPPTSVRAGQDLIVKTRILDDRDETELKANIYYRALGSDGPFTEAPMEHRTKTTYTYNLNTTPYADTGVEYYLVVSDGINESVWPASGGNDGLNAVSTVYGKADGNTLRAPTGITTYNGGISWNPVEGNVFWYKIYRDDQPDFVPSAANYVTYVEQGTTSFTDTLTDFDGSSLVDKPYYYKVTAVDKYLNESAPTQAVLVSDTLQPDPTNVTLFTDADRKHNAREAKQPGASTRNVLGYVYPGGYAVFNDMQFPDQQVINAVNISYSAEGAGGYIEIWIDGTTEEYGQKLGEALLSSTGKWDTFTTKTVYLDPAITGAHDVYFVFREYGAGALYNLDYFYFTQSGKIEDESVSISPVDMMAFKSDKTSSMRRDVNQITEFGNPGDRIVLGDDISVADASVTYGGGGEQMGVVAVPGYGLSCVGYFGGANSWIKFSKLPSGKLYLAYDSHHEDPTYALELQLDGEKVADLPMGENTGSDWNAVNHKVMYKDTGIESDGTAELTLYCRVPCQVNICSAFVEQAFTAKQIDIVYSNEADTQYSLYVNGEEKGTIVLPNSNGQKAVFSFSADITDGVIDLRVTDKDLAANGATQDTESGAFGSDGNKATIYNVTLYPEGKTEPGPVVITAVAGEGGQVDPAGEISVENGQDQTFTITAQEGYEIESVMVNGFDVGPRHTYVFQNVTHDATLEATFAPKTAAEKHNIYVDEELQQYIDVVAQAENQEPVNIEVKDNLPLEPGTLKYVTASAPDGVAINEEIMQFIMPDEDVTIVGEIEKEYKVTFNTNGGSTIEPVMVRKGETVSKPADPTRSGYTFEGWYTDEELTTAYDFNAAVTGDITLYAKWVETSGGSSSTSTSYTITVTQSTGGKISPSTTSVRKGSDKTFTITANEGYKIADVLVDGKSVGAVSTYTFKNVTARHTITAKFEKNGETGNVGGFIDVKADDWFADAVAYVVGEGLMNGTSSNTFTPSGATTRGMIVTILYRQAGSPEVESDKATWWSDARVWAMENGVSDGTNMDKEITREQLATMLYRYAELMGENVSKTTSLDSFKDGNKVSAYAVDALKWAAAEGIVTGKTGNIIDPQAGATRAETATMFMRFCEKA